MSISGFANSVIPDSLSLAAALVTEYCLISEHTCELMYPASIHTITSMFLSPCSTQHLIDAQQAEDEISSPACQANLSLSLYHHYQGLLYLPNNHTTTIPSAGCQYCISQSPKELLFTLDLCLVTITAYANQLPQTIPSSRHTW